MKVYKFGGASIASPARARAIAPIVEGAGDSLAVVISAMGKTTNALEEIVLLAWAGSLEAAQHKVGQLEASHLNYAAELLDSRYFSIVQVTLCQYFISLEKAVSKATENTFDKSYDSIVCFGELFSTIIISSYFSQVGIDNIWVDARKVIVTDDNYRDAAVDNQSSASHVASVFSAPLEQGKVVVTQGFIAATRNGESVTLGREGSDYTAALLASYLGAVSVTIWKDVDGLMNADPKMFANTKRIEEIAFNEVIEMAFYGAQIIHPKTIKPLQNADIPLYVKCFLDPNLPGTVIGNNVSDASYPALYVLKNDQLLLQVTTRDFSFINEDNLSKLYAIFHKQKVKVNLIQNAAISFVACIDNNISKVKLLTQDLNADYKVLSNENVSLLTIRHYNADILSELVGGKQILLKQETRKTVQVVMA